MLTFLLLVALLQASPNHWSDWLGFFLISFVLELVAKPHRHFFNVIMMQANWKKATNIPI